MDVLFSGGVNWYPAIIGQGSTVFIDTYINSGDGPIHARVPIQAHPQFSWKIYNFS